MEDRYFYVTIESSIVLNKNLNSTDKILYGMLVCMSKKNGFCKPNTKYLCEVLGIKKRQLLYCLKKLKENDCINIQKKNNKRIIVPLAIANMKKYESQIQGEIFDFDWLSEIDN